MVRLLKRFEAWAIASRADPFFRARWKLTLLYVALITAVVVLLSTTLYAVHGNQLREEGGREIEGVRTEGGHPTIEPLLDRSLELLGRSIILLDAFTIVIAGGLSFWLADRTLRPIRDSVRGEQRFFASAAHDLRTPLAVMRTEIEVALRNPTTSTEEARGVLVSSLQELGRMTTLVEELLLLGTHNQGLDGNRRTQDPQDLADLVATTAGRFQGRASAKQVSLMVDAAEPVVVNVDASRLERALANVIENSLKFTPAGGTVRIALQVSRAHADVVVTDTGIGIQATDLAQVTEPFYRADTSRSTPGSGLGLAIVRQVMSEHGGMLEISSYPGQGTRVRLRLRRALKNSSFLFIEPSR